MSKNERAPSIVHIALAVQCKLIKRRKISTEKKCQVYKDRPLGCLLHPVVYSIDEGVIADEFCPMRRTVSKHELKMKGKILLKHLKEITSEVASSSI